MWRLFEVLRMKNKLEWEEPNKMLGTALAKRRSALKDVVRFLARRAAERTWKPMQHSENRPQTTRGDSQ